MSGQLHLIIGCMFSGKTSKLISYIRKCQLLNQEYLVITHVVDKRYGSDIICSHDKKKVYSEATDKLISFKETEKYKNSKFIFIEEAQFFDDLKEFVINAVEKDNKIVTICGLDGDFKRKPFGQILELIPYADSVEKLSAYCIDCGNGTQANFSKRITDEQNTTLIGSTEKYKAVCRKHFL
jgi:thymidine kinase